MHSNASGGIGARTNLMCNQRPALRRESSEEHVGASTQSRQHDHETLALITLWRFRVFELFFFPLSRPPLLRTSRGEARFLFLGVKDPSFLPACTHVSYWRSQEDEEIPLWSSSVNPQHTHTHTLQGAFRSLLRVHAASFKA